MRAANTRWRSDKAQAERDAGIEDIPMPTDLRQPITLDLRPAGGELLVLEPCLGKIAWRALNAAGEAVDKAAIKTLLHRVADKLGRQMGARNMID